MTTAQALPTIGDIAAEMPRKGERFVLHDVDGWMQGRTMYGGASSFLAYSAVRKAMPGLPALRGAQIGFVAPVGAQMEITVSVLREGRSVSQVQSDLYCKGALAHRGLWLFGNGRTSNGTFAAASAEDFLPWSEMTELGTPEGPHFLRNLDVRRAEPRGGLREGAVRRWVRLKDRRGLDPIGELILLGDALPPGSMRAMERQGPISSINWSLTLLGDNPVTQDGWWLMETASNHMADGFSSETLRMWNAEGIEVMRGLQSVAIFG